MQNIDVAAVTACIDRSLQLFDKSYSSVAPGVGGWYHRLEANTPGPSATAVALHGYLSADRIPDRLPEGLAFLGSRQIKSNDKRLNGGWPVNTSNGRPVLEATSLVVRLLGSHCIFSADDRLNPLAAYEWVEHNQNPDGGWGSAFGQQSRVWLTAMAVRALLQFNINSPGVVPGIEWLIRSRDSMTSGWGEKSESPATVTHTAFVLICLTESRLASRRPDIDEAIRRGFLWLSNHVNPDKLFDDAARTESYNVHFEEDGRDLIWQNSVWHPGLPFALQALLRDPRGANLRLVCAAVNRITRSQSTDGRWPNPDSAEGISVWSVWPFVDSLCDFKRIISIPGGSQLTWLTASTAVIRQDADKRKGLMRLYLKFGLSSMRSSLKRWWSALLLTATFIIAGILLLAGVLDLKDAALTLILPVLLVFIQELILKSRRSDTINDE